MKQINTSVKAHKSPTSSSFFGRISNFQNTFLRPLTVVLFLVFSVFSSAQDSEKSTHLDDDDEARIRVEGAIEVSPSLFEAISDAAMLKPKEGLRKHLLNNPELDPQELRQFFTLYFGVSEAKEEGRGDAQPEGSGSSGGQGGGPEECTCEVIMPTGYFSFIHGKDENENGVNNDNHSDERHFMYFSHEGVSKSLYFKFSGDHTRNSFRIREDNNFTKLYTLNLCSQSLYGYFTDDCQCDKTIDLEGSYQHIASSQSSSSGWPFSRGSRGHAGETFLAFTAEKTISGGGSYINLDTLALGQIEVQSEHSYSYDQGLVTSLAQITAWATGLESFDNASVSTLTNVINGLQGTHSYVGDDGFEKASYDLSGLHTLHANVPRIYMFASNSTIYCKGFGPGYYPVASLKSNLSVSIFIPNNTNGYKNDVFYEPDVCCNEPYGQYYISPNYMGINNYRANMEQNRLSHLNILGPVWDAGQNVTVVPPGQIVELDPEKKQGKVWGFGECGCEELLGDDGKLLFPNTDVPQNTMPCDSGATVTVTLLNCGVVQPPVVTRWFQDGNQIFPSDGACSYDVTEPGIYTIEFFDENTGCSVKDYFEIDPCPDPDPIDTTFGDTLDGNPPGDRIHITTIDAQPGSMSEKTKAKSLTTQRREGNPSRIELFPNPARRTVSLRIPADVEPTQAIVQNANGIKLQEVKYEDGKYPPLDISELPTGVYYILLEGRSWKEVKTLVLH